MKATGSSSHRVLISQETACDDCHTDRTASRREHDGPSTANFVDVEVRGPAENSVLRESAGGEDEGHRLRVVEILLQNVGEVIT